MAKIQKSQNNNKFCVFFKGVHYVCGLTMEEAEDLKYHLDFEFEEAIDDFNTLFDHISIFPSAKALIPSDSLENFGQIPEILTKNNKGQTPTFYYDAATA